MALIRQGAQCPFCNSSRFAVNLSVNDWPDKVSESRRQLSLVCAECGARVFEATETWDNRVYVSGVSLCNQCRQFLVSHGGWREESIRETTYPVGTSYCPKCHTELRTVWWCGWNYTI